MPTIFCVAQVHILSWVCAKFELHTPHSYFWILRRKNTVKNHQKTRSELGLRFPCSILQIIPNIGNDLEMLGRQQSLYVFVSFVWAVPSVKCIKQCEAPLHYSEADDLLICHDVENGEDIFIFGEWWLGNLHWNRDLVWLDSCCGRKLRIELSKWLTPNLRWQ